MRASDHLDEGSCRENSAGALLFAAAPMQPAAFRSPQRVRPSLIGVQCFSESPSRGKMAAVQKKLLRQKGRAKTFGQSKSRAKRPQRGCFARLFCLPSEDFALAGRLISALPSRRLLPASSSFPRRRPSRQPPSASSERCPPALWIPSGPGR